MRKLKALESQRAALDEQMEAINTLMKAYSIICNILNYALQNDIILKNPCAGVTVPKAEAKECRVMTAAEQELFEHEIIGTTYEALYRTGLFTGMRLGELLGLTWNDVDFSKNSISVYKALAYIQEKDGEHGVKKEAQLYMGLFP